MRYVEDWSFDARASAAREHLNDFQPSRLTNPALFDQRLRRRPCIGSITGYMSKRE
jgi:hypothetical protein